MKKNKFLSGLGAKLALAIVALTTTMFTSCEKENIEIEVTPVNAKAYITPVVVANGVDVTSAAVITFSETPISANGSYYYEGTPNLAAKTITVSATYNGMEGTSASISIPAVAAGNFHAAVAKIFVSYPAANIEETQITTVTTEEVANPTTIASFTNDGEYTKKFTFNYIDIEGAKVIENDYTGNDEAVLAQINKYKKDYSEKEASIEVEVPAYTILTPDVETVKTTTKHQIVLKSRATGNVIATFVVEEYKTEVNTNTTSIDHGHGHDHDHGHGNGNAGGGISNAD